MSQFPTASDEDADAIFEALTAPDEQPSEPPKPVDPAKVAVTCLLEALAEQQAEPFDKPEVIRRC